METVFLVHGGIWDDMTAQAFWHRTGVHAGLAARGLRVLAPQRPPCAPSWEAEADALEPALLGAGGPVTLVGASNGCPAAVLLALRHPDRVAALVLAWPATAGDEARDARFREAHPDAAPLLAGETLRGVTDAALRDGLAATPVALLRSLPENPVHRHATVDALRALLPHATELPAAPEAPRPGFAEHLPAFLDALESVARRTP